MTITQPWELPENIRIITKYENITPALEADLEALTKNNLLKYQDSYLKPYLTKTDAIITVSCTFSKNKQDKYEAKYKFNLDGKEYLRNNDVPFKEPFDVVNHAFKHLKEYLANK
jgi:hypothetical protein